MTRKEILFICLIICCLFSLQAVAAASDGNSTDHVVLTTDSNVSAYSLPNTDNQLRDGSDAGTFSDLQNNISGKQSVTLVNNFTYDSSEDSGLANGITISSPITIDGQGNVIIDASKQARVFNIAEGVSVTLKGITFINGNVNGDGGSISSLGVLTLIDCSFINNTASGHGGAVYLDHSTQSTIENCDFTGNVAGLNGGAIDWRYGSTHGKVINSTFTNNTAKRSGGAIHWSGHDGTIRDSIFTNNTATGEETSIFGGIEGGGDGGAVLWVGSNGTVVNCTFIDNNANRRGGAIFLHGNTTENCINTTVSNSNFDHNFAGRNGGAIDWQEGAHYGNIYNSTFTNNMANANGGAVFWSGHDGEVHDSNFTNNTAKGTVTDIHGNSGDGGAIIWSGINGTITNSRFINNSANKRGGAVYLQNCTHGDCDNTTFDWCVFINNTAGVNGGALDWHDGAHNGNVYNSTFTYNTAGSNGGAIFWSGHHGVIRDSNFTNNTAKGLAIDIHGNNGDGGAIIWSGINGTVDNCRFIENEAKFNDAYTFGGRGGAVYLQNCTHGNCTNTTFTNVYFEDNVAGTNGGALDWHDGAHDGLVENATFINNTARRSGGAIFWDGHNGTVKYSKFYDNHALGEVNATSVLGSVTSGGDGGAIIWSGALGNVVYCNFVNNTAAKRGGAIFLQASEEEDSDNTTFKHSYFKNNTAGTNGGAIDWNKGAHNGMVDNITFINNTAKRSGGAIYWFGMNGTIINSRFINNTALGIANATDSFGNITSGGYGGAVMWTGSNGTIQNSTFDKNKAEVNGGAIFLQGSKDYSNCENIMIRDSRFTDNFAGTNGGAVDFYRGALNGTVSNCSFVDNTANRSGGAIFWFGRNGTIHSSNFTDNRALGQVEYTDSYGNLTYGGNGGAIMWTGYHGSVDDCYFETNFAENNGGAVYLQGSDMGLCTDTKFDNCTFVDNTAGLDGGAINWYVGARNGTVINSNFINNTAMHSGGAISWNGIGGNVSYSNFTLNHALGIIIHTHHANITSLSQVVNVTKLPNASSKTFNKLYVLIDYDGDERAKYTLYVTVINDEGKFEWLNHAETTETAPSATDWAIDYYFGGDGGSILWEGDRGVIDHCNFIYSNSARRGGGAYMLGSDHVTVSNSYFENSTSGTNGGGLDWLAGANYGKVINCTFNNTRAARSAGAIYYDGDYGEMVNITIINTTAYGGALKECDDKRVHFAGWDVSHWDTNTTGGDAGAIMITGSHTTLKDITFTNCTSAGRGGAVFLQDNDNVTFDACTFENNRALGIANNTYNDPRDTNSGHNEWKTGLGGAVGFDLGASNGTIKNSKFINNTAARDGGAISFAYGSSYATIYNSSFINNTAKRSGGAFSWDGSEGNVSYCNFTGNKALGTAIDTDHVDFTSLSQVHEVTVLPELGPSVTNKLYVLVTYEGKTKTKYELYVAVPDPIEEYVWIKHTETDSTDPSATDWATDEYFGGDGGSIIWGGDHGIVDHCIFIDSDSARRGGGAYMQGSDNVTFSNCYFENSTSGTNGGGLDWLAGANYGKVINCTFNNTRAARSAGAIYYDGDYGEMTNITIINATSFGGALKESRDHKVKYAGWDASHWDTNTTGGDAGAIMFTGDNIYVYNATFTNCTSAGRGGAVFLQDNENVTFELCLFEENSALGIANNTWKNFREERNDANANTKVDYTLTGHGGAIAFDVGASDGHVIDSTFIDNHAHRDGGAIYYAAGATRGIVINSTFINHTINYDGGAIYLNGTYCEIHNSTFLNNSAKDDGGAIFWQGDHGIIYNITCDLNHGIGTGAGGGSSTKGGVICLTGSDVSVDKSTFTNSYGGLLGGSIFVTGDNVNITNSVFKNSTIGISDGGALYILGDDTLIKNCTFDNCTSPSEGGTIYVFGDRVILEDSTITNSTAINGGAIFIEGNEATINNTQINHVNASVYGGAIYVEGDNAAISVNITDTSVSGMDNYVPHIDSNYNNDHIAEMLNKTDEMIGFVGTINCEHISQQDITRLKSKLQDIRKAIENVTTANGRINSTNVTVALGLLDELNETLKQINATLTLAEYKENTLALFSYVGDVESELKSLAIIDASLVIPENILDDINSMISNLDTLESKGVPIETVLELNNTLQSIKDDAENIFLGNKFNLAAINLTSSLLAELNQTLTEINATLSNNALDELFKGVEDTNKELNNLTDIIMENVVIPKAYGSGGAVYISGDGDVITDSHISQTSAYYGGAVYISGNDAAIENSDFKDINATEDGGALYISGDGGKLYNSNFTHNLAGDDGGAIYWSGDHGTIENIVCDDNHGISFNESSSRGGAICLTGNDVTISKSKFTYNNITYNDGANLSKIDGGALFITGNDVIISDTEFSYNNASHYGGTIYVLGNETVIDNCTIDNSLAIRGGAIYVEGENATISAKFKNTNATLSGGAIYVHGENTTIVNSSFDTAYAFGSVDNGGGAIMVNGNYTSIEKSNFTNTHADNNHEARGGAIYIKGICANITDSDFDHSRSNLYGGSIYINGTNTTIKGSNFTDCTVNSDGSQGGAIYVNGEYTTIIGSAFDKNTAKEEGGAIYIHGVKTTISNSTFEENSVNGNGGGAIYVNGDNATIEGSNFTKNEANVKNGAKGGAIYVEGKYALIDGSNFDDSSAKFRGGAIYIDGLNAKVKDSNFTNSSVTGGTYGSVAPQGGAIYIKANYTSVEGSIFNHSSVSNTVGEGGAIFIEGDNANILTSEFEYSTANCGGAMYSTGSNSLVYNSNFTNNLVELNGGAIYWYGGSNSKNNTVDGCIFINNTAYAKTNSADATRGGGAIYWSEDGKYGTVKNSKFYYNSVQSANDKKVDGGAILWDKSYHALVDHCDFVGNFVTTNGDDTGTDGKAVWAQGGAMYLRPKENYTISNCLFENCSSSKEAGALYIQSQGSNGDVTVKNTIFKNNFANNTGHNTNGGGAVQIKQAQKITFQNVQFINNSANKGGAVSVYNCKNDNIKLFDNCTFENNTAKGTNTEIGYGGAIFYTEANKNNLNIQNSNFTYNKAEMGSAIYSTVDYKLTNVELLKNRANTSSLDLTLSRPTNNIDITLKGWDNRLNALYVASGSVTCTDVTYWTYNNKTIGEEEITNSSQSSVSGPTIEKGISITVELFNRYNEKLSEGIFATDANGEIHLALADFAGVTSFNEVYVVARLTNEDYYTQVQNTTRLPTEMQATAHNVTYHRNATVNVTMAPSSESEGNATGIISVYYNDTFLGNITLADNNKGISDEISTLLGDRYLEVGTHNLTLRYWGDLYNDAVNLTVPINVTKAQSNITIIYEDMGYDLWVNVTIVDDFDDIYYKDATGNVVIEVYSKVSANPLKTAIVTLVNGTGLVRIENLLPSNYTIKANYTGDHNYYPSVNSTPAEVREKADTIVDILVSAYDIMVDETFCINITILSNGYNATGNVTLYLDNEKYILPLNDSKAYFDSKVYLNKTYLQEGKKTVSVYYDGNSQLIPNGNDATFWVHKYNTTISVNTTNITHIQHEVINITLLNDTVGVVSVFINGDEYFARINNGTAILELPLLPVGEYNVTVTFPGDDKYNNNTTVAKFSVLPVTPDIVIDVENVTYGNSTPIVVTLINCAEGTVSIEIDGTSYDVPKQLNNGRVEFSVSNLAAGNHNVKAIYSGDANHTAVSGEKKFTVYKANRTVLVDVQDIVYGNVENINVYVNATGNVTIKINGRTIEQYKVLDDNSTQITVANLAADNYNVEVIYNGNENYTQSKATATFTVSQMDTSLDIQVHDVLVWNKEYINITVRNSTGDVATNLNGTLTINIDGVDHSARIIKGIAQFNIVENSVGDRVVWVFFEGDNNFKPSKAMDTYKVKQRTPSMEVIAQDILVGEDGNITVKLPANATGYVEVRVVGDNTYYSHLADGVAVIHPKNLNEGNYIVNVKYHGNEHDNYTSISVRSSFTVSKAKVNVTIDVNDTVYGNVSNIVVYIDDGVEGSITIRINDTLIGTYGIVGGKVNTTVSLAAGTYTVHAEYNGNYRYAVNNTESKDFTVAKATPVITIDTPQAVNAATNATIIVRINETATGNITITVNGTKYNATIENGFAVFTINQLLAGQYDITAEYGGDGNYTAADAVTLAKGLTVTKVACYQINVTANDTLVDVETTIVVKVPSDAKGNVSIYIDGEFAGNATINQGIAQLNVTRPYGNHTVNATFTDDKYGPRYAICDFWVFKHESPLEIAADSIVVGDVAYINVTAPSDNVTIEINGKTYDNIKYENGIAYFEVSGLEHGDKTVVAIYGGSDKYVKNTTTGKFTVSKRNSQVNVTVQNITVGGIADIEVKVPADAKGYVVVVVNSVNYTANLTAGVGHVHIKDLGNGTYNVNVTYIGDEKYLTSTNSTKLGVTKSNTTLDIAVESINYGDVAEITVTVAPSDASGFITVRIEGGKSITLPVVDGKVSWNVSDLAAGTYTVYANYSGDGKYNINNTNKVNKEFTVRQITPEITVVKVISEAGKNATVIVRIDSRTTENITVTVNNKPYSVKPDGDGIAVVVTDVLENGTYVSSAAYPGDTNFTQNSVSFTFTANKTSDYVMNITAHDIEIENPIDVVVNVPADAKGIVKLKIDGTNYTATISNGKATFTNTIDLPAGRYNITAYFGDKKYENKTATGVFYVSKHETPMTIEDITAIKVGDKAIIKVTAPIDVLNDIYIEIDGVKYTDHTVSEGKAVFEVPIMSNGTRTVVATYDGGNKYSFNSSTQKFDVGKRNSYVKVDVINTTVGSGAFINVTVPANATGYVIVKVDNTNYTINLTGGKGNVTVYNLENKTYDVTVTYIGDYQYLSSTNATKLAIDKLTTTFEVNGTNITVGAAEFIRFETPDNITGLVKVEINDKNYTAFVNEGKGNLTVCGLEAGDYNVTVYFEGNYKYLPAASAKNKFTVNQTTAEIVIIPQNITYGETETIIIYVNATGKVNVTVVNRDEEDYKVTDEPIVDGKVTIVVPGYLTAGNYTVKVDYSGNVNVSNASAQEDFEVAKADPIMTVSVQNITYGDVEHIRATVNAEGNITIKVNGKETTIVLENGNLVIGVLSARVNQIAQFDGKAGVDVSGLEVGEYPVEVTFNGNENYNKLTINTKFLVTKDNVTVSVQVEDIRTDGKEVINVTLSNTNVTGNVTINVDGINYTRPIKDGKANLTLDKLSNATHSVVVIYEGDRNFNGNWTSDTFNVTKVEPEISVDVANKKVGETERIVVHLPDNATGYVVIDVDGTEYHVDIVAGQEISIEIDNLENKTYDVNVYYSGDGYWQSTTSSDSFNVSKVKSSINITVIHDGIIPNGTDVDIFIKAPGDITGKVNVTVWDTVRDENTTYTVYVNEGNGTLHIETPLDGIYKVNATYLENGKYLGSENYTSFDVYNTRKPLSVNSDNGYVNENEPIYVTVQGNHVDEYLTVVISNSSGEIKRNETVRFNNYDSIHNISSALWKLQPLDAGHYDVKAIYIEHDGDKVYTYEGVNDFNIWKLASEIKIKEIKNITVGENATIELEIELDPRVNDGNISVFVNGRKYMTNTSTLKVIVPGLGADNYTVEAIYHGNRWYNESSAESAFKVEKNPAPISITVTNSKVGEIEQINVTLSENITGRVLLDIGDNHYYANITDGVAIFNITKLDAGKYNVTATYDGNYKYFANSTNSTLEITKWDSFVNVTADNITYGDKAVILVETPKDLCGNVTVSVDGENYTVFVSGGHGTLVVPGLNVGPHDVNVTFDGCNKYEPSNNNTIFNVNKVDLNEVDMKVIDYGNGTAVVVLPGNATGNVTIKIDDKEFYAKVVNGTAVVQLDNVTPGTHVAEVIYSGDDKYNATTKMANITAPKYESPINITVGEIVAGENGTIIVSVLENATGNVTVSIGGKQYYGEVIDGIAVVEVGNLTAGPTTFVVEYSGDDNYRTNYTVGNFTVDSALVNPDMTVVDYGNGTVVVVVPEDAVGNVTITVDGKNYTAEVVNGTAVVQLDNVTPGTHEVEVIYSGDDKYNSTVKTTDITAPKYDSPINITVGEIVAGENGTIIVSVLENATGNVTVSIGGKQYYGEVIDGIAVVEVGNLTAGPKTVVVEYSGDDNYDSAYKVGNFTVDSALVNPDMTVVDYGNGTVVVVLPEDAEGNVTITVDGQNYTAEVVNGTAVVQLDDVAPGTHVVEVIYSGDDKYNSTSKTTDITAPKYDSPINITVGEIVSGENGTITVALPENATGNVTVSVDGKEYSAKVINGTAVVEVGNLTAGPKTVVVEYSGDDNYDSAYKVGNFTVEPAKVIPDVTVVDQGNGTLVIVVPEDAAGNVTVTVDGKEYEVEVVNGTAVVQLENVTPGTHEIEVKYSGDDKYNSTVKTTNVTAPKYDSPIDIEIGEIIAGENGTIVVKLPENAKGNVTVSVDGKQYTAEVINGTATVKVDNLTAGPKTIAVEYSGDDNYDSAYKIGNFTVDPAKVTPDITVVDQGNGTVVVVVPSDATGNVTVTVDGKNYTAEIVNGTAVVQLDNVTPGAHEIEVIYGGDDKYANATANAKVTAPKLDTPITVEAPESKVGDKAIVTVTVPYDATGNVTIEIDGVKYTSQIKNGKAVFEVENLAAGTKTIAVEYAGDDNYIANHTTGTTTVSKCPSTVSATITDIDVGENVTITVTVPEDATGQVLIDIDGVGYYVNVTGGVGTASIPRMPNGIYNVSLTYTGDDKYLSSSNNASFNVSKVESFVIPTTQDITVGEIEVIRLTVPEDATGTVTVVIDGVEYDFNLDDGILSKPSSDDIYSVAVSGGKGVLVISGLPKGQYVVSARYNGDSKYLPSTNTTTFIVSTQVADIDIEDLGNGTIIVHAPKDATGTVTVTVDGEKYTADVVNGTAVINLDNVAPGTKNVEVAYSGDDNYAPETVNSTVSIPKYPTPISVEADDINVGDTAVITVTVPNDAKGIVTIEIDGNQYNADVVDGKAIFKVNGLKEGDKTVAVRFDGGDYYEWNSTTASFTVSKVPSTIKATAKDITAGSDEVITVTVPKDATGQVLVDIDGVGYYGEIINGKAKVIIPKLPAGKYTAKVFYDGDDKYLQSKTTVKFTVNKAKAPVSATGDAVIVGEDASIVVKLPNDATGTVTITVAGKTYTTSVINGEARFRVPGLSEGDHKVKVHYSGDENYDANDTVTTVIIEDADEDNNETADDVSSVNEVSEINKGISLSDYPTGNPLLILLLVLLAIGTSQIRRFRK